MFDKIKTLKQHFKTKFDGVWNKFSHLYQIGVLSSISCAKLNMASVVGNLYCETA